MSDQTSNRQRMSLWQLNKELVEVLIKNTIETYPPEWRLIQEPIQNAIDSFLNTDGSFYNNGQERKITLELYIGSNKVIVKDNGKGVSIDKFPAFLYLGSGTKRVNAPDIRRLLKGSQGVGIKSTVFTSNFFKVSTVHGASKWEASLEGFSRYADPSFPSTVEWPIENPSGEPSGTKLEFQLNDYSVADFLNDRAMEFFEQAGLDNTNVDSSGRIIDKDNNYPPFKWMRVLIYYLKKYSYLGCVSRLLGDSRLPPIKFELRLICDMQGAESVRIPGMQILSNGETLEETDQVEYVDFSKLIAKLPVKERPTVVSNYKSILEAGNQYQTPTVFYAKLTHDDVVSLLGKVRKRKSDDPQSPSSAPNIIQEDRNVIDRNFTALERVNGGILFIASRPFLKQKLAHKATFALSVNGLPTDIALEITGAELGYLPSVHFILDVNEPLGYGKRNLHPRSKGLYNQLGKDLWRTLHQLASLLVAQQEDRDQTVQGKRFDKTEELTKVPRTQQDVAEMRSKYLGRLTLPETEEDIIQTFFFMMAKGHVPYYKVIRLSDHTIYDGILSSGDVGLSAINEGDLLTVEFKKSTADLCESDSSRKQIFEDMNLAIVWEATKDEDLPSGYFSVAKEVDISFKGYRPGVGYRLKHNRNYVQVIALKDVFDSLCGQMTL